MAQFSWKSPLHLSTSKNRRNALSAMPLEALAVLLSMACISWTSAFLDSSRIHSRILRARVDREVSILRLVPIADFESDFTFLSEPDAYRLCIDSKGNFDDGGGQFYLSLVDEEDLPDLCRFVVEAFGADAIRMSQDMSAFERMFISPAAELLNGYSGFVAFAEVFSGTKQRLDSRLKKMDISPPSITGLSGKDAMEAAEKDSLILALARPSPKGDSRIEVIASIELRLQPCDAKIPFSLPWLDKVERRLASSIGLGEGLARDLQPYLSNLCVQENYRGKGIGKVLVRCVENIAQTTWGCNRMYLHVDEDNVAAVSLYKGEAYRDVGHRWNPIWAGGASDIGYYVKTLRVTRSDR